MKKIIIMTVFLASGLAWAEQGNRMVTNAPMLGSVGAVSAENMLRGGTCSADHQGVLNCSGKLKYDGVPSLYKAGWRVVAAMTVGMGTPLLIVEEQYPGSVKDGK